MRSASSCAEWLSRPSPASRSLITRHRCLLGRGEIKELRARMRAGAAWQDHGLIFCQPDGRPWNPDHVSRRFRRLAAEAGVPVIKLHEARHSAISLMRDAGVDQSIRMREAGQSDAGISDRYTHILTEAHLAAAEQVAGLVRKAGGES